MKSYFTWVTWYSGNKEERDCLPDLPEGMKGGVAGPLVESAAPGIEPQPRISLSARAGSALHFSLGRGIWSILLVLSADMSIVLTFLSGLDRLCPQFHLTLFTEEGTQVAT